MAFIGDDLLIRAFQHFNPWWNDPSAAKKESKLFKRTAYYEALKTLRHSTLRCFVLLAGARGLGKSTIMHQMIEKLIDEGIPPQNILYVSFDHPVLKAADLDQILAVYESLVPADGMKYLFFDEIQYSPHWELWMKVTYDTRKDIRLAASASAIPIPEKGKSDSGVGRWSVLNIPVLSFYEYCYLLGIEEPLICDNLQNFENFRLSNLVNLSREQLHDLINQFRPLERHFNHYLVSGGNPGLALSDNAPYEQRYFDAQKKFHEDIVTMTLFRDLPGLFDIPDLLLMEKLFVYLCIHSGQPFDISAAAKELQTNSVSPLNKYLEAFERANLICIVRSTVVGEKGNPDGKPIVYIADLAIRNTVLMIDETSFDGKELQEAKEAAVKTAVYNQLVSFYQGTPAQIGYFQKAEDCQSNVDAVIKLPRRTILYKIRYCDNSHIPETDAIVDLCQDEGAKVTSAFVIIKNLEDFGLVKHDTKVPILRIPAIVFLYLLGLNKKEYKLVK